MHTVLLLAIFGFTAVVGMLILARRPVGAALGLVVAVAWPATLVPADRPVLAGVLALVGVLAILFLLRRDEPARGILQAAAVGVLLVALAAAVSTTDAVAKPAFLSWQTWDPYDRPTEPVSVSYVWDAKLRRDRVPGEADHGPAGQGAGAKAVSLLAGDDARRLHRALLGRGPRAR